MSSPVVDYFVGNEPDELVWRTSALFPLGEGPRSHQVRWSKPATGTRRPFGLRHLTVVIPTRVMPLSDIVYCPERQVSVIKGDTVIEAASKETYDSPYRTREDEQYYDDHKDDTQHD